MKQYIDLLQDVYFNGEKTPSRQGGYTYSVFGRQLEIDCSLYFPVLTTKKVNFSSVAKELAGFLAGATDTRDMFGVKIWDADAARWAKEEGRDNSTYMGKVYGYQWRKWLDNFDQLQAAVDTIRCNPSSRRIFVSAWAVHDLDDMCLPPCHTSFQFKVQENKLSLLFHMRSVDVFLGLPFDIASYALLLHIVAKQTKKDPYMLIAQLGDTHIYEEHIPAVQQQMVRKPKQRPLLHIPDTVTIDNFVPSDAMLLGYDPHPAIGAELIT